MSICAQMTTNLPGLAFGGDGWLRLSHEGEDYDGRDRTSSCSYLWMMSYVSFIFPELGFTMMIGCATGFYYEFAWLAASKERNKIGILNLFLLVSWTTMSYYFSECGFSL